MTEKQIPPFTAKFRIVQGDKGYYLMFFCGICDKGYTTPLILCGSREDALSLGKQDARLHFNRCVYCHLWVCDEHYNENRMVCTNCQLQGI